MAIAIAVAARRPIMLWGPRGDGKSSVVKSALKAIGYHMIDKRGSTMDALDLPGLPYTAMSSFSGRMTTKTAIPDWLDFGPKTCIFFDEFPQMPVVVMNAASELLLDGTIGGGDNYTAPEDMAIVLAGNGRGDKCATNDMPGHIKNRVIHIYPLLDAWEWAMGNAQGFPDIPVNLAQPTPDQFEYAKGLVTAFIRTRPNLLSICGTHEMVTNESASPRTWDYVQSILPYLFDKVELQMDMIAGCVGEGPAGEFIAFMTTVIDIPDVQDCLTNPLTAAIPNMAKEDGAAICYALGVGLVAKATQAQTDNFYRYIQRLPPDFANIISRDHMNKNPNWENGSRPAADFFAKQAKFVLASSSR